jgi:molybdopterin-containing oxidoreductase family membrane subunit
MAATAVTLIPSPRHAWPVLGLLTALVAFGLGAAWTMETEGHHITGMSNHIVWGLPHMCAIFLILAASGSLNVASVASVFGRGEYKSLAPLSALVSIALLAGGLSVLVLDLGRPDRLMVALLNQNPFSIFAWNVLLYTGFAAVAGVYLWTMLVRRQNRHTGAVGVVALLWRLVLTTGTGSILGFLAGRAAFHGAMMAPLFVAASLADGLAVFTLVLAGLTALGGPTPDPALRRRLGQLLGILAGASLYFAIGVHLNWLYAPGDRAMSRFLLLDGGVWPLLFWGGQVLLGTAAPLWLLFRREGHEVLAAWLVCVGGFSQLAVLLIGGQAIPRNILPGWQVASAFGDGRAAGYVPSLPEALLGLSGFAIALLLVLLGCRLFRILPRRFREVSA